MWRVVSSLYIQLYFLAFAVFSISSSAIEMDYHRCRTTRDTGQYFHGRARARVEPQERVGCLDAYAAQEIRHGEHLIAL